MKHSFKISGDISYKAITIKNFNLEAECEYSAEEMKTEGDVFSNVIDTLCEKFSWLAPLAKRTIELEIHNKELLSRDLEKQIQEGTTRAYGPNGWSVRNADLHGQQTKACKCDKKH